MLQSLFVQCCAQIIVLILKQNLWQMSTAKIIIHLCLQCFMINHCQVLKWEKNRNESFALQNSKELFAQLIYRSFPSEIHTSSIRKSKGTRVFQTLHNKLTIRVCIEIIKLNVCFQIPEEFNKSY